MDISRKEILRLEPYKIIVGNHSRSTLFNQLHKQPSLSYAFEELC